MESEIVAKVDIKVNDKKIAKAIFNAIEVETKNIITERSRTEILLQNEKISFIFNAKDLVALRAAINSYLRMLYAVVKVLKVVQNGHGRRES